MKDQLAITASHREWEWYMPGSWHPMPSIKGVGSVTGQSGIPVSPPDHGFLLSLCLSLL